MENNVSAEDQKWFSIMAHEWEIHSVLPWDPNPPVPFVVAEPMDIVEKPDVMVLGYVPYWTFGKLTLHLDKLHVLAYFGVKLNSNGSLGDMHHWGSSQMNDLIETSHNFNVKVILTVTNFSSSSIHDVVSSESASKNAIKNIVNIVSENGGDGVNVDFEGLSVADKQNFVNFVTKLKTEMDKAIGESHVSIATPAVDWSGAFDYDQLAINSDGLMIMGYGYHWAGGQPGPCSPLSSSAKWGKYSLTWTLDDYIKYGGEENKEKLILGLPLYGFDWPTKDDTVPGTKTADADAVFYAKCQEEAEKYGWIWDEESQTPYFLYKNPSWHQVFCENSTSMSLKYQLISSYKIGGVGYWALGYEEELNDVWEELSKVFPNKPSKPEPEKIEFVEEFDDEEIIEEISIEIIEEISIESSEPSEEETFAIESSEPSEEETFEITQEKEEDIPEIDDVSVEIENERKSGGSGCIMISNSKSNAEFLVVLIIFVILVFYEKCQKASTVKAGRFIKKIPFLIFLFLLRRNSSISDGQFLLSFLGKRPILLIWS